MTSAKASWVEIEAYILAQKGACCSYHYPGGFVATKLTINLAQGGGPPGASLSPLNDVSISMAGPCADPITALKKAQRLLKLGAFVNWSAIAACIHKLKKCPRRPMFARKKGQGK